MSVPDSDQGVKQSLLRAKLARLEAEAAWASERHALKVEGTRLTLEGLRYSMEGQARQARLLRTDPFWQHDFYLHEPITDRSSERMIQTTTAWAKDDPGCAMRLYINSPGGSVLSCFAMFDHLRTLAASGHAITTIGRGMIASAAGILFQAGDERRIGRESWFLIHEVSTIAVGKLPDLEDEVAFAKAMTQRILDIFVDRSGGKVTKAYLEEHSARRDWWISSDEVLRLGLADTLG